MWPPRRAHRRGDRYAPIENDSHSLTIVMHGCVVGVQQAEAYVHGEVACMTALGAGLTLIGFSKRVHGVAYVGIVCLTVGLLLALLGLLDVGIGGRRHWF